jgi:hypothetical protein
MSVRLTSSHHGRRGSSAWSSSRSACCAGLGLPALAALRFIPIEISVYCESIQYMILVANLVANVRVWEDFRGA